MTYLQEESKVICKAKKGRETKNYDALELLAPMCFHAPNWGEQMVSNMVGTVVSVEASGKRIKPILQSPISLKLTRHHRQNAGHGRG
jgi:hypothetical protein